MVFGSAQLSVLGLLALAYGRKLEMSGGLAAHPFSSWDRGGIVSLPRHIAKALLGLVKVNNTKRKA